jgi:hypothetical protein
MKCSRCEKDYPISFFPSLTKIGIVCEACLNPMSTAGEAREVMLAQVKEMTDQVLDLQFSDESSALPKLKVAVTEIYKEFGGPRQFAAKFRWMIDQLSARRPFPASAAQLMINFLKLHHSVEQTDESINARQMTDEQIKREQQLAVIEMVMDAAGDPVKLKALESIFRDAGMKIVEIEPEERLKDITDRMLETANDIAEINRTAGGGEEKVQGSPTGL